MSANKMQRLINGLQKSEEEQKKLITIMAAILLQAVDGGTVRITLETLRSITPKTEVKITSSLDGSITVSAFHGKIIAEGEA